MTEKYRPSGIPEARYSDLNLPEYRDNPLISALPLIPEEEELVKVLQIKPRFDGQEKNLSGKLRGHAVARLLNSFFQPLTHHLDLEYKISLLILQGYVGRNPSDGSRYRHLQNGFERLQQEDLDARAFEGGRSTAAGFGLFGCSGCGKTRALERILSLYPQALFHPEFNITQLIYLKVDCPIDGDLDELCLSFFNQVDRVLGTRYSESHGRKKMGTKRLMASMCQIANLHALGVLVIDEVQNLNEARSGGAAKMNNFFVSLVNTIGVPVIQVGTVSALKLFERSLRIARRISEYGCLTWDRLPRDEQWHKLMKRIWKYQWLQNADTTLTDELEETMYDLTQGVMDIVIKLFVLAQIRAIAIKLERIDAGLLRKVYDDELKPVHPMLAALRSKKKDLIAKYDDLLMPAIEIRMLSLATDLDAVLPEKSDVIKPSDDQVKKFVELLMQLDIPEDVAIPMADDLLQKYPDMTLGALIHKATAYLSDEGSENSVKPSNKPSVSRVKQAQWNTLPPDDLRHIHAVGPADQIYDRLKTQGLVFDLNRLLAKVS